MIFYKNDFFLGDLMFLNTKLLKTKMLW